MPYFSFSIKENINLSELKNIKLNTIYFSKNTNLWKILNSPKLKKSINFIKYEHRKKTNPISDNIIFCLPPSIGLGDAIEYSTAISIIKKKLEYKKIGIAFTGKYSYIFKKLFNLNLIYENIISLEDLNKFGCIFHPTLEIEKLKLNEYYRSNIKDEICNHFNVSNIYNHKNSYLAKKNITTLSIFPISKSVIRTMPLHLINEIVNYFYRFYKIEIFFDNNLEISQFIEKNIVCDSFIKKKPKDLVLLLEEIKNIQFGIFIDSGPLHVAKIFGKKGLLIETSVDNKVLLEKNHQISAIKNEYKSNYCKAPCGLVNIFNYNNKIGCYDSIPVNKKQLLNQMQKNKLKRGIDKKELLFYLSNPVGCVKTLNIKKIIKKIKEAV